MKTTLTELISEALAIRKDYQLLKTNASDLQLATNALEERINEMIDARIQEALKSL